MGFEHRISFKASAVQKAALQQLLVQHPFFSGIENTGENVFFEFRIKPGNKDMPDFSMMMEEDEIYVIHNSKPGAWADIYFVRQYLVEHNIATK